MSHKNNGPGGCCCCPDCAIFNERDLSFFNLDSWTVVDGIWSTGPHSSPYGYELHLDSPTGLLVCKTSGHADDHTASTLFLSPGTTGWDAGDTLTYRAIVGYADSDNYLFAQAVIRRLAASPWAELVYSLGERRAGLETILDTQTEFWPPNDGWLSLDAYYANGVLSRAGYYPWVRPGYWPWQRVAITDPSPFGQQVALYAAGSREPKFLTFDSRLQSLNCSPSATSTLFQPETTPRTIQMELVGSPHDGTYLLTVYSGDGVNASQIWWSDVAGIGNVAITFDSDRQSGTGNEYPDADRAVWADVTIGGTPAGRTMWKTSCYMLDGMADLDGVEVALDDVWTGAKAILTGIW